MCLSIGGLVHRSNRFDSYTDTSSSTSTGGCVGFGPGDIVGCYIHLHDYDASGNYIRYYKNGVDLGVAFANTVDGELSTSKCYPLSTSTTTGTTSNSSSNSGHLIPSAIYYPAISLYRQVTYVLYLCTNLHICTFMQCSIYIYIYT